MCDGLFKIKVKDSAILSHDGEVQSILLAKIVKGMCNAKFSEILLLNYGTKCFYFAISF